MCKVVLLYDRLGGLQIGPFSNPWELLMVSLQGKRVYKYQFHWGDQDRNPELSTNHISLLKYRLFFAWSQRKPIEDMRQRDT